MILFFMSKVYHFFSVFRANFPYHSPQETVFIFNQLYRACEFLNLSFIKNEDFIIVNDSIKAMGNRDDCCFLEFFRDHLLDHFICFQVYTGCSFIHQKNFGVSNEGTSQTKELSLSQRVIRPFFVNFTIKFSFNWILFFFFFLEIIPDMNSFQAFHNFFI